MPNTANRAGSKGRQPLLAEHAMAFRWLAWTSIMAGDPAAGGGCGQACSDALVRGRKKGRLSFSFRMATDGFHLNKCSISVFVCRAKARGRLPGSRSRSASARTRAAFRAWTGRRGKRPPWSRSDSHACPHSLQSKQSLACGKLPLLPSVGHRGAGRRTLLATAGTRSVVVLEPGQWFGSVVGGSRCFAVAVGHESPMPFRLPGDCGMKLAIRNDG